MAGIGRGRLVEDLRRLGVKAGDAVMMHSSLGALGPVEGGAETVVDALLEALGPGGTLLVPAFRDSVWDRPEDFANTDCECTAADGLCPSRQPGFQGIIAETVRRRAGTLRSCHPTHSWVALGPAARRLLQGHRRSLSPCGRGNPFEALLEIDGVILLLGVQVNTVTLWHYYEELLGLPYVGHYWPDRRHLNHCVPGRRIQYEYPGVMQDLCRAAGILATGPVGKSTSGLMTARQFDAFTATILANNPDCLVLRPPDRVSDDLLLDALQKAAAMLAAWRAGPAPPPQPVGTPLAPIPIPGPDAFVREDCPAFGGFRAAGDRQVPLCRANGRHPDLFRLGGDFDRHGPTTCGTCSWNRRFPRQAS